MAKQLAPIFLMAFLGIPAAQAQNPQWFAMIGLSEHGYYDEGTALKLGADFAQGLGGVRGLGLTAFYAYTDADDQQPNNKSWNYETHSFALGPQYTAPFAGSKWSWQVRAYLELDRIRWEGCRCADTDIDIGIGLGLQYALDGKTSVRVDYDDLGGWGDALTVGLGFKF